MDREFSQREGACDQGLSHGDVTVQETYQEQEVLSVQEISQWGARRSLYQCRVCVSVREVSRYRAETHQELYEREETVRVQELYQWEEDGETYEEVREWEERVTTPEVSQGGHEINSEIWDRPLHPMSNEEPQTCPAARPSSPSPVGTEVEAEAAPALRSASPAPGTAMETEPAAAAPSGDDEKEEPPKPLVPEEETAAAPSVTTEELPSIGTRSPPSVPFNTPASSQASGYQEPNITREMLSQALLEMLELRQQYEKDYAIQQWMAVVAAATAQREESPVPAPHSPPSPSPAQLGAQALREQQEEAAAGSVVAVQGRMEDSDEEMKFWQFLDDLEPFLVRDPEQSQESLPGQSIPLGEGIPELVQENWEDEADHGIWNKPLHPEDEWDEVSVLELPAEDKEQKHRAFAADGLPVPVPREAWVEGPAPEPCSPGPLCASPAALQGRAPVGHAASPALEEPVPEAGTESPVPAPRKRPSRFRRALRALRGLFRCPCLAPQPEE